MIILQPTDFKKYYSIAQSPDTTPLLQDFIDRYEKNYIHKVLGVELGDLFIADLLVGVPETARFISIFNAFSEQIGERIYESKGFKDMLTAFVLYEFISQTQLKHSQSGVVSTQAEVANIQSPENAFRFGEMKFNEALETKDAIQYVCGYSETETFPEFKGVYIRPKYSSLL